MVVLHIFDYFPLFYFTFSIFLSISIFLQHDGHVYGMGPFVDDEVMEIAEEVETNTELDVGKGLGGKVFYRFRSAMKNISINIHKNNREREQQPRKKESINPPTKTEKFKFSHETTTTQQEHVVTSRKYNICSEEPFVIQQQTFHLHRTQHDKEYAERTVNAPRNLTLKLLLEIQGQHHQSINVFIGAD